MIVAHLPRQRLSQSLNQWPLWKLPLFINKEVASKGLSCEFSLRGIRFTLGRRTCSLFRLVLNYWRLPYVGRAFGGWQVDLVMAMRVLGGRAHAGKLREVIDCCEPRAVSGGQAGCLDGISWMVRVAKGGTADTRAVTPFTGHSPGHLIPPLTSHQAPLLPTPRIWRPGQQERVLPSPGVYVDHQRKASAHQMMTTRSRSCKGAETMAGAGSSADE